MSLATKLYKMALIKVTLAFRKNKKQALVNPAFIVTVQESVEFSCTDILIVTNAVLQIEEKPEKVYDLAKRAGYDLNPN